MSILCIDSIGQTITPNVIISAGGEYKDENTQVIWTLGDFLTSTLSKNELSITQGFLQTYFNITDVFTIEKESDIKINVFPNPVIDFLNIRIEDNSKHQLKWELINQTGMVIKRNNNSINLNEYKIDFTEYNSGIYFIRTYNSNGNYFKVFKIVYLKQ